MSRIRIGGGTHRSRLIDVASVRGLRPTPDRVRQTLFNWLGQDLKGLTCLDLFAGSGILGFEAASRGAVQVDIVEQDRSTLAALKRHSEELAMPQVKIFGADALQFAARPKKQYDLIFLDPPYGQGLIERVVPLLAKLALPEARIYAEAEAALEAWPGWQIVKQGKAGHVFYHLLEQE